MPMDWSPLRDALTRWRTWTDAGAVLFLCWFLLLLVRSRLVRDLQSFLLADGRLISVLPWGIATPRAVVAALASLGIPLAAASLLAALLSISPPVEGDTEPERRERDDRSRPGREQG